MKKITRCQRDARDSLAANTFSYTKVCWVCEIVSNFVFFAFSSRLLINNEEFGQELTVSPQVAQVKSSAARRGSYVDRIALSGQKTANIS